nr:protein-lysine n-methyltransferase rrg1 [Quercus suber]
MSTRTRLSFDVKSSPTSTICIQISDPGDLQAENLPLETWGSAEILANQLHRLAPILPAADDERTLPVLELGAGTGIAGLTAAAVWHTTAVLTDLPPILPGIEANVHMNHDLLSSQSGQAFSGMLDWADPSVLRVGLRPRSGWSKAQIILAADTVYSEDHPELLCNAITSWLAPAPESRFVACYPLRIGYLDHIRDLWERLEAIGLECVQEGREMAPPEWDEDTPYEWCSWAWRKD